MRWSCEENTAAIVRALDGCLRAAHANVVLTGPSFIGQPPAEPAEIDYLLCAQRLAVDCDVHVIQCNWPNSLNKPEASYLGESVTISPAGNVLFRLPRAASGIAVFELGASDYRWMPEMA